jgi:hypothetical protein
MFSSTVSSTPFLFSQALLCTRKRGCALIHSQRMNAAAE